MDKEYIQKMFAETLSEDERLLISVASVICVEGLDIEVLFHLYMPDNPHVLYDMVDSLCRRNWLFRDHKHIYCDTGIASSILEKAPVREIDLKCLLENLDGTLSIEPLDDHLSRQQYFVAARLLLGYIMEKWEDVIEKDYLFIMTFLTNVIHFASNVDLSFHNNKRQPVACVEERIDYKLLLFAFKKTGDERLYEPLGALYSSIFRYDDARFCFDKAERSSAFNSKLLISLSEMYWNLSLTAKSFQYAYNAYVKNKEENYPDKNINVCLYLSLLCGLCGIKDSCVRWLQEGKKLIKKRRVPDIHPIRISLFEIESLIAMDDSSTANEYLDKAELMAIKLYGSYSPELSMISYIHYVVYANIGQSRKSIEAYRDYVDYNHYNFGYSAGDVSILYSSIIESNNERGCYCTSGIYEAQMQELHAENVTFAPGVRISKAFSEASTCMIAKDYNQCASYVENARGIFLDEIKPDEALIDSIRPVFEEKDIPDVVIGKFYARELSSWDFEIELGRGEYSNARRHVLKEISNEDNLKIRLLWSIHLGRIAIKEGNTEEGIKQWKEVISQADASCKFEISKEIAEWSSTYELYYESIGFFETALQAENMLNATTKDIAVALRNYADVLETCGMQDKSDEPWLQAINLLKATNDRDGLALAYWYWGATKQDYQAEVLLSRAIKYWKQEPGVFDETLSHMYRLYSSNLGMQGKIEEARSAAQKAISLYPSDYPDYLEEEIESYL